jgi:hypothetical protein
MLYAEFTTATDWWYEAVDFRELYNLSTDPFQLENLWPRASTATRARHIADMNATWGCQGAACP